MITKKTLFSIVLIANITSSILSDDLQQPKKFDNGGYTHLAGFNSFARYTISNMLSGNYPTFPQTKIIKFDPETGTYTEKGILKDHVERRNTPIYKEMSQLLDENNAIHCPCIEQRFNKENDELETVGAIIYGTRNTAHCETVRQILEDFQRQENMKKYNNNKSKKRLRDLFTK